MIFSTFTPSSLDSLPFSHSNTAVAFLPDLETSINFKDTILGS
jgi:hypothetical protein